MSYRQPKASYWQDAPLPREQLVLFATTLEHRIPDDHPVRLLDEITDQLDWTPWESEYCGKRGQPPIHPSILFKVLLFAMIRKIRSSRQIEYHLKHSIDFMWLASGRWIDHSTLSEFRRKHPQALKQMFRQLVGLAVSLGVANLSELCIDGTKIRANSSRFKNYTRQQLTKLLGELGRQIEEELQTLETNDHLDDLFDEGQSSDALPSALKDKEIRRAKLLEALGKLDALEESRRREGIDPQKKPGRLPATDTDGRLLPNKEGGYAPNYTPMAVTETQNGFIVEADVLIGHAEHTCLLVMVDEVASAYGSTTTTVMADGAYSTGPNLASAEERAIELLSPVRQELSQAENPAYREDLTQPVAESDVPRLPLDSSTKRFSSAAFAYVAEEDVLYCPQGQKLHREGTVERAKSSGGLVTERKRYRCAACAGCPLASLCRVNPASKTGRRVGRDEYQAFRERQVDRMQDPVNKQRYRKRTHYGEAQFGHIKGNLGWRQFLLRGHEGVCQEWRWGCTAFNMIKLMNQLVKLRAASAGSVQIATV